MHKYEYFLFPYDIPETRQYVLAIGRRWRNYHGWRLIVWPIKSCAGILHTCITGTLDNKGDGGNGRAFFYIYKQLHPLDSVYANNLAIIKKNIGDFSSQNSKSPQRMEKDTLRRMNPVNKRKKASYKKYKKYKIGGYKSTRNRSSNLKYWYQWTEGLCIGLKELKGIII